MSSAPAWWLFLECRDAIKRLSRAPGFVLALGLSYGLGVWIALTTTALAGQYGLRPPPGIREPASLRRVFVTRSPGLAPFAVAPVLSYPELQELQALHIAPRVEGYSPDVAMIGRGEARRRTSVALMTKDFLRVLRVDLQAGRFPEADDERNGVSSVAVISDRLWQRQFARSQSAIGGVISVNAQPVRVIGILSPRFPGLDRAAIDVWLPIRSAPVHSGSRRVSAESYHLSAVVRIGSVDQVPAIEQMLLHALSEKSATGREISDVSLGRIAADRIGRTAAGGRGAAYALGLACTVLVLSLANCILLTLGRVQHRLQELCTRSAVGAPASVLVLSVGLELGIVMGAFTALVLIAVAKSKHLLRAGTLTDSLLLVDGFLLGVAFLVVVGAVLLVFSCSTVGLLARLRRPLPTDYSPLRARALRKLLIGGYVAVVCALTIACLPVTRAFLAVRSVRPGFSSSNAIVTTVASHEAMDDRRGMMKVHAALARLEALPFRYAVAASSGLPYRTSMTRPIGRSSGNQSAAVAQVFYVRGDFLGALGVPILLGSASHLAEEPVGDFVVINRALAEQWWSDSPIGRCVFANGDRCNPIVAVAGNVDAIALGETPRPTVYAPLSWLPTPETMHFVLRTKTRPTADMVHSVDRILGEVFPSATTQTELLREIVREQSAFLEILARLTLLLLIIASTLAFFGLRASVQYAVQRRRHELGIRAALGANPARLVRCACSDLVLPGLIGALLGAWLGVSGAQALASLMPGMQGSLVAQLGLGAVPPLLLLVLSAKPAWNTSRQQPTALLGTDA